MNVLNKINLPEASRYLISLLLKKGATLNTLSGTNAYILTLKGKEYIFMGEFTPLMPYMYGIVFSNQKYWFEILKELKLKFAWESGRDRKKIAFLVTRTGFFNALLEKKAVVKADGKANIGTLIKDENMRRINSKEKALKPINIEGKSLNLRRVPTFGEEIAFENNFDYEDITKTIDKKFVSVAKKIINFLPGLMFLRFEVFVKKPKKIDEFILGKVSVSPGVNIFFKITDGKAWKEYNFDDARI